MSYRFARPAIAKPRHGKAVSFRALLTGDASTVQAALNLAGHAALTGQPYPAPRASGERATRYGLRVLLATA